MNIMIIGAIAKLQKSTAKAAIIRAAIEHSRKVDGEWKKVTEWVTIMAINKAKEKMERLLENGPAAISCTGSSIEFSVYEGKASATILVADENSISYSPGKVADIFVQAIGRLGKNPTDKGYSSLATDIGWGDKKKTLWWDMKLPATTKLKLGKGSCVSVLARYTGVDTYEDKPQSKLMCESIAYCFLPKKQDGEETPVDAPVAVPVPAVTSFEVTDAELDRELDKLLEGFEG